MSKRPYNPTYHSGMVDNCRRDAKSSGQDTLHLTDEQVYDLYMEAYFYEDAAAMFLELVAETKKGK